MTATTTAEPTTPAAPPKQDAGAPPPKPSAPPANDPVITTPAGTATPQSGPSATPPATAQQPETSKDSGEALAVTPAEEVQTEVLPAEEKPEGTKKIIFLRALGRKPETESERTLIERPPTGLTPAAVPAGPPPPPPRPGFLRRHGLFVLAVILPTLLAMAYFGSYATPIFVSESSYVVRSPNKKSAASSGLGALLDGAGFSGFAKAPDDVYAISQYIRSRDALNYLDDKLGLHAAWSSDDIDLFRRFDPLGWDSSREALYDYYLKRVAVGADASSGITTLTVTGFTAEQVLAINELLLGKAEELVNILNERGRNDLIRFAENEVRLAEDKAKEAAQALSDFRNTQAVVDPEKQTMLHFEQISRLQEELIRTRGQLTQLRVFAPDSPHPPALELQAQTLEREIEAETEKITGGEQSLASKAAEYQRLQLEREFADKQLAIAMSALEGARSEAQRQQLYLETIAKPSLPDEATFPKRFRGILSTLVLGLVAWGILSMLLAGVREHQH